MKQFSISVRSFADIQEFVALSARQPFAVCVGEEGQDISGKSLMAMLGLNFRGPIPVRVDCDEGAFRRFREQAARFLA